MEPGAGAAGHADGRLPDGAVSRLREATDTMNVTNTFIRKRCGKCGRISPVRPRIGRCRLGHRTLPGRLCGGSLTAVPRPRLERPLQPRPQEAAAARLRRARKMLAAKMAGLKRLMTSISLWERRAAYYARRASMTDAEVAVERVAREAQMAKRRESRIRRAISLEPLKEETQ